MYRKTIIIAGIVMIALAGSFYGLTPKKGINPDTFSLKQVKAAETESAGANVNTIICGYGTPKSKRMLNSGYLHEMLYGLALSVYIYQQPKPYANLTDINGDGLPDYLYGYYEPDNTGGTFCVSLMTNKGENKFEVEYNCTYSRDSQGVYYQGTCADPDYIRE